MRKVVVAFLVGAILGLVGARYLFVGSWLSLIPWGIAGLLIGYWSQKREWLVNGICYGFTVCFVFMLAGYAGSASLVSRLPFFALIGAFGAFCGLLLSWAGFVIGRKNKKQ
jgi:hypothetical protein